MIAGGRTVSYGEIIRTLLDNIDVNEPDVAEAMDMLVKAHPELTAKIGKYRGVESDDEDFKR